MTHIRACNFNLLYKAQVKGSGAHAGEAASQELLWTSCYAMLLLLVFSQFTKTIRKRNQVRKAGTQQCNRIWEHVKKSIPKSVSSRSCDGYLNTTNMLSYVYAWLWRRRCRQTLWKGLADLCHNVAKTKFEAALSIEKSVRTPGKVIENRLCRQPFQWF